MTSSPNFPKARIWSGGSKRPSKRLDGFLIWRFGKNSPIRYRQVWAPRAALVVQIPRLLPRAVGRDLVGPIEQLGVNAVAFDQPMELISTPTAALAALDVEHVELADQVAEDDRAVAGHYNHPSTRNARSICAVAISMSDSSLVCAAFSNSATAKSQCGRAWRHGFICPMKRAASCNVANAARGPLVRLDHARQREREIVSRWHAALRPTRAEDLKHRCTRSSLRASVTNYSNYYNNSRGRSTGRSSSLANPSHPIPTRDHQSRGRY